MQIRFLGTGASGGTPGRGRSRRWESSALVTADRRVLIDVTRHFADQRREIGSLDAALLTHAHRDACGGLAALRDWWRQRSAQPLPVYASSETIAAVRRRLKRLDHCDFIEVTPGRPRRLGRLSVTALTVPHARERRHPTFAWKLDAGEATLVYASDLARLTGELERFAAGASLLVIDGAMWGRSLFSHLTIDRELPRICRWRVERILLTQLGRTLPPHDELVRETRRRCRRAAPAYDGMEISLGE